MCPVWLILTPRGRKVRKWVAQFIICPWINPLLLYFEFIFLAQKLSPSQGLLPMLAEISHSEYRHCPPPFVALFLSFVPFEQNHSVAGLLRLLFYFGTLNSFPVGTTTLPPFSEVKGLCLTQLSPQSFPCPHSEMASTLLHEGLHLYLSIFNLWDQGNPSGLLSWAVMYI